MLNNFVLEACGGFKCVITSHNSSFGEGVFWLHIELQYSEHEQLVMVMKEIFKDIVWFLQGLVILNISLSVDK